MADTLELELEDGEISDGECEELLRASEEDNHVDDEIPDDDWTPLPRPTAPVNPPSLPAVVKQEEESGSDSEKSSNSDSDDSGAGGGNSAWRGKKKLPPRPNRPVYSGMPAGGNGGPLRKLNNVWSTIAEEQSLAQGLTGFAVNKDEFNNDRSVESYDYTLASTASVKRKRDDYEEEEGELSSEEEDPMDWKRSDRKQSDWKRKRIGDSVKPVEEKPWKRPVKERVGTMPMKHRVELNAEDPQEKIVYEMAYRFSEPKVSLLGRVVETVGNAKALSLLSETEDIEHSGGLLTLDGSRRRTPGGVFLQLLKNDPDVTKEQLDQIFLVERQKYNEQRGKERKRKRKSNRRKAAGDATELKKEASTTAGTVECEKPVKEELEFGDAVAETKELEMKEEQPERKHIKKENCSMEGQACSVEVINGAIT